MPSGCRIPSFCSVADGTGLPRQEVAFVLPARSAVSRTLGQYANNLVSIIVLKQSELDHFPQLRRRLQSGDSVVCSRTGRYQFAARLVGDHMVCAVADGPKQMPEDLIKSVRGPG